MLACECMSFGSSRVEQLRLLFLGLVGTASAVAMPACDGDELRSEDFKTDACEGDPLHGVTPAVPVDYLELRSDSGAQPSSGQDDVRVLASSGFACANAVDKTKCQAALESLRPVDAQRPKAMGPDDRRYLVFTRGDEVGAVTSVEALRTFLAPFENPKDGALLLEEFTEHRLQCGGANVRPSGDAFEFFTHTGFACGEGTRRDANGVRIARDGTLTVVATEVDEEGDPNCQVGRRPEGYASTPSARSVADHLAATAELEAVSVLAFRRLSRELRAHGAPSELVARARSAAKDEIRHARATRRLAARFGGTVKQRPVGALPVRSLEAIAEENAREGCVRETFGALVATMQAARATDAAVRAEMETIARDETEHAALAWDVAEWLDGVLDGEGRARTGRAREEAAAELQASLGRAFGSRLLGLPGPGEARALLARMQAELGAFSSADSGGRSATRVRARSPSAARWRADVRSARARSSAAACRR